MERLDITFLPHWRREVGDVANTLRSVLQEWPDHVRIIGGGRVARPQIWPRESGVVVASDHAKVSNAAARLVVRLWWNGADEVLAYQRAAAPANELHVCFFPDVALELEAAGVEAFFAPYVFAPPVDPVRYRPTTPVIGYAGEVDISETCFLRAQLSPRRSRALRDVASALAASVTAGERPLADVQQQLAQLDDVPPETVRPLRWAVRNHVRHQLMADVTSAFPNAVQLRGDDWVSLGFSAKRTNFSRRRRRHGYGTQRVCLDLGSKSTEASLYPRSAEIMAVAGGIAQFASGSALPAGLTVLAQRRATSSATLVALIGAMFERPDEDIANENRRLLSEYSVLRVQHARSLLRAIVERAHDGAFGPTRDTRPIAQGRI